MEPFLLHVARRAVSAGTENLHKVCVVFPNRRAGLYFRYHLSNLIDRPVWMPEQYALEDFLMMLSGLEDPGQLKLILKLFRIYRSKGGKQPFVEFINWSNTLLADFNEIDQYLADGVKVFSYIDEAKAISHWNPDGKALTPFEQQYLEFYRALAPLCNDFRRELLHDGEAYAGLAFAEVIADLSPGKFSKWDKIIFAGFNALTRAESELIQYLTGLGKAEVIFDADAYYLENDNQEAGKFLRNHFRKHPEWKTTAIAGELFRGSKKIEITGIPGSVGQAKYTGSLLQEMVAKGMPMEGISVVLVDENLLLPVLNSIPDPISEFNVTMGYPLKLTPIYSLLDAVFRMFVNASKLNYGHRNASGKELFYFRDLLKVLLHPGLAGYFVTGSDKSGVVRTVIDADEFENYVKDHLPGLLEGMTTSFRELPERGKVLALIRAMLAFLKSKNDQSESADTIGSSTSGSLQNEYLYQFAVIIDQLDELLIENEIETDNRILYQIFNELASTTRLPFSGEPLKGIQVMGMLETRVLDFHTVILLSANEGMLPKGKHSNTFIPEDIRQAFGLPTYHDRNAVFAYHFYRLMQRAENIYLLYNSEGNNLGGGEKSRFLIQLLHELPVYNPGISLTEKILSIPPAKLPARDFVIPKNREILNALAAYAEKGFSPTAIASYLHCGLQFCLSYVMNISQPEEAEETIDVRVLGNIIHEVFEKIYTPYIGRSLGREDHDNLEREAMLQLNESLHVRYKADELKYGKNHLVSQVAGKLISNFLKAEAEIIGDQCIEILMLEKFMYAGFEIHDHETGEIIPVKLKGKVDRIDLFKNTIRIIDYKTGTVSTSELKIEDISGLADKKEPSKLVQLLSYAYLFSKSGYEKGDRLLQSGIIPLRTPSKYFLSASINKKNTIESAELALFEQFMGDIFSGIFNPSVPFSQTEDPSKCRNCAFREFCDRIIV